MRYMKHPCREFAFVPELLTVFQDAEKNILHQIFARFRMTGKTVKKSEQNFRIPFKQNSKFAEVAGFNLLHQIVVRCCAQYYFRWLDSYKCSGVPDFERRIRPGMIIRNCQILPLRKNHLGSVRQYIDKLRFYD